MWKHLLITKTIYNRVWVNFTSVKIKYDYSNDIMNIDGSDYQLKPYRKWLISNHEEMVQRHFVKAISTPRGTKYTFDWSHIYFLASEYGLLSNYLKSIQ